MLLRQRSFTPLTLRGSFKMNIRVVLFDRLWTMDIRIRIYTSSTLLYIVQVGDDDKEYRKVVE